MSTLGSRLRILRNMVIRTNRHFSAYSRIAHNSSVRKKLQLILQQAQHTNEVVQNVTLNKREMSTNNEQQQPQQQMPEIINQAAYEKACIETLDALSDYFEILTEELTQRGTDVSYGDGVLTINLGEEYGTYVINRQTPNRQIWLSSPTSGPKRYDFIGPQTAERGQWIYKHDNESLHALLQREMQPIFGAQVDFFQLPFAKK